ncbi:MAG TPA: glycosyltransferase [Chitinophagaceae bacterium]|nr:glycosyltransferase [Chitinophagaceae bacterium]
MTDPQLVSVIMPAYNAEKFIAESINSVIAQTYKHWELIVIDDGSEDNTKLIINEFINKESRIKYVYQANGKQGKARNKGIGIANGELIAFLDSDDIWKPKMLEKQVDLITKTGSDLVFSDIKFIDAQSNMIDENHTVPDEKFEGITGIKFFLQKNLIPTTTVLAKKAAILKVGGFKTSNELQYAEDYDLWLRILVSGARFVYNLEPLALYRKYEAQSTKLAETRYTQILDIIKNLPIDKSLQKEKDVATYMWLRRSLRFKNLGYKNLRKLIRFIPSFYIRKISICASYVLPMYILRRVIYQLSFLHRV